MACRERQNEIELYSLGELEAADSRRVAEHLAGCPACSLLVKETAELAGRLDAVLRPPAGLLHRILAAVEADRRQRRPLRILWPSLAVAAALVAALAAWRLWPAPPQPAAPAQLVACRVQAEDGARYEVIGERTVWLHRGRIFVEVQKAKEPLVVRTPAGDATALGTKFYVQCDVLGPQKFLATVTVVEGVVELKNSLGADVARAGEQVLASGDTAPQKQAAEPAATPVAAPQPSASPSPAPSDVPVRSPTAAPFPAASARPSPSAGAGRIPGDEPEERGPAPTPTTPGQIPPPPYEPGSGAPGGTVKGEVQKPNP